MKIVIAQQNYHIGNFESNVSKIVTAIEQAKKEGADLVVFSEMCVCGYPARDFLDFNDFIDQCYLAINTIKHHADTIGVIIGSPARNNDNKGKKLFNAAFLLYEQQIVAEIHKTLLPTYDVFDEYRYFEPAFQWQVANFKGKKLAITICEDIWNIEHQEIYRLSPMDMLIQQQPDLMINISASPYDYTHETKRHDTVKANAIKYQLPIIYCNAVGSQTEIVFDGGSMAYNKNGQLATLLPSFQESLGLVEINFEGTIVPTQSATIQLAEKIINPHATAVLSESIDIKSIHTALILGIQDYFKKMGFTKAILGSSGGIDSAVVLALACEALGPQNVLAVLMPSPFSSDHSVNDAIALSNHLSNPYHIVRINDIYDSFLHTLEPIFNNQPFGLAEENMQSRTRGNILMSIANKFGYILLNTSNKSELSTGYGTLYGDMAGGLGVLGDCYKTIVYALAIYINRDKEIIPTNIITKAPSAELRPNQKDSDSLPDYAELDAILNCYIENTLSPSDIKAKGFNTALVDRVIKLVNTNEYKRNQFCPIIRISPKAFGVGRRMPIVGKYLS